MRFLTTGLVAGLAVAPLLAGGSVEAFDRDHTRAPSELTTKMVAAADNPILCIIMMWLDGFSWEYISTFCLE